MNTIRTAGLLAALAVAPFSVSDAAPRAEARAGAGAGAAGVPFDGGLTCVIPVRDLDRSVAWYVRTLGMRLMWLDGKSNLAELRTHIPSVIVRLARHPEPRVEPGVILTLGVSSLDVARASLVATRATVLPVVTYPGLAKVLPFRDPDGNVLQLAEALQPADAVVSDLEPVAFLAGSWVRENGDNREEEHWTAPAGGMMVGMGRTVKGGKATFFEHLRIERTEKAIVYWASPGGIAPTPLTFDPARSRPNRAVFENPAHDFPRTITYTLDSSGDLRARIEGTRDGKPAAIDLYWRRGALQ